MYFFLFLCYHDFERSELVAKKEYNNILNFDLNKTYSVKEVFSKCNINCAPKSYQKISYWNSKYSAIGKRLIENNRKAILVEEMKIKFVEIKDDKE